MSNAPADSRNGANVEAASPVREERSERELLTAVLAELRGLRQELRDERERAGTQFFV